MLTIKQLADYVGVTTRTIRYYHQLGLLPEPQRSHSGYRLYHADDVIRLQRIKILTDAGMPLARIGALLDADDDTLAEVATEVDAQLTQQIAALQQARRRLKGLLSREDPYLDSPYAHRFTKTLNTMAKIGISETTIRIQRDSWILLQVICPELEEIIVTQLELTLQDPDACQIMVEADAIRDWEPDDPRLEELAQRYARTMKPWMPKDPLDTLQSSETNPISIALLEAFHPDPSSAVIAFSRRVEQLMTGS